MDIDDISRIASEYWFQPKAYLQKSVTSISRYILPSENASKACISGDSDYQMLRRIIMAII